MLSILNKKKKPSVDLDAQAIQSYKVKGKGDSYRGDTQGRKLKNINKRLSPSTQLVEWKYLPFSKANGGILLRMGSL